FELSATWSLSVEEQFYLVWPLVLLLLLRLRASRWTMAVVVAALGAASSGVRMWLWHQGATPSRVFFGTDAHADGLLAGALTGMLFSWGIAPRSPRAGRLLTMGALVS